MAKHLFLQYIYEDQPAGETEYMLNALDTLCPAIREPYLANALHLHAGNFDYDAIRKALLRVPANK